MFIIYLFMLLLTYGLLRYIEKRTQKRKSYKLKWNMLIVFGLMISIACFNFALMGCGIIKALLCGICSGWLFFSTCTDIHSHDIYIFPCPVLGILGIIYQTVQGPNVGFMIFAVVVSFAIHFAFTHFWGKGDGYVFAFSSLFFSYDYSLNLENFISNFLLKQMLFILTSIIFFAVYNLIQKNMKLNGKLKKPKEFAPSIAMAASIFF